MIYPFYLKTIETSKIYKFYNLNTLNEIIYSDLSDNIIKFIQDEIYKGRTDVKWDGKEYIYITNKK